MQISQADFEAVELRIGRIASADRFPEARRPAYRLVVDFGPEFGRRNSSAQITARYTPESLVGRLVIAVTNLPPKRIGPFVSEVLVTGFVVGEGEVLLAVPDGEVALGTRLC